MRLLCLLLLVTQVDALANDFLQLSHVRSKTSAKVQEQAAADLIQRLVGERSNEFDTSVDPSIGPKDKDTFQLSSADGKIKVVGTSGVAASMGFYYYLKYYCHGQRTWAGQQTALPEQLPDVTKMVTITTNDRFRYYQNVCTLSYTMAFWDWERWEQEIDWMALHGINMPLAFIGQEAIFQRVYLSLGFTQADMNEHFAGPAFLAWGRMGNIRKWGGPLPQMWITGKLILQHKILQRMRSLGMTPILPAFAGHVPSAIKRVYPDANVTRLGAWGHFDATYSATYLLDFQDPLFKKIGNAFIQAQAQEFGTDHLYNCDTFNEMRPASSDPRYLAQAGQAVFDAMRGVDAQAVWVMQGWMFGNSAFWGPEQVKGLVLSVPIGRMIILDLYSELDPIYSKQKSYYGQPFIWCMLHNFGGTMELYGAIDNVRYGPFAGRQFPNSTMIGLGITPEGIHQNEVIYEFMSEHAWRKAPWDLNQWIQDYAQQRYGGLSSDVNAGWLKLLSSVYNCTNNDHHDGDNVLLTTRPSPNYNANADIWYNQSDLFSAWESFVSASKDLEGSSLFQYDLVDVTRNSLQDIFLQFYVSVVKAYQAKDRAGLKVAGKNLTDLLGDMETLLASNGRFLLGRWEADAVSWGTDDKEKELMRYNALNQITLWGPNGQIHDYAGKQWSGLMKDFHQARWQFFVNWLDQLVVNGTNWDGYIFDEKMTAAVSTPFTKTNVAYPTTTTGDSIIIAQALMNKYRPFTKNGFSAKYWDSNKDKPWKNGFHSRSYEQVFAVEERYFRKH